MRKLTKIIVINLITIVFIFALSLIITNFNMGNNDNSTTYNVDFTLDTENPKISAVSEPIYIDDTDPTKNWSITEVSNEWCNGSGLINDPYVIENVTIDASGFSNGIFIENSNVYFIIKNCVVYNASIRGIRLKNVDHGIIYNNTCSQNPNGIYLGSCDYNNITNNYIINNFVNGIELSSFCSSNTISGNIAINNNKNGIVLRQECLFNNITNNTVIGHTRSGILIQGESNNNNIKSNTVNDNPGNGISLYWSHQNNVSVNIISHNKRYGILLLEESSNNVISQNLLIGCGIGFDVGTPATIATISSNSIDATNLVNGKPISYYINKVSLQPDDFINSGQVILLNCINSLVSNLNLSYGGGISLYFSNNNEIIGNTVDYNYHGISLKRSDTNTISGNIANNCIYGIYLRGSDHNTISENYANNKEYGIFLSDCINNTISENYANNNEYGIYLQFSYYNIISGNNLIGNNVCIDEFHCEGNIFLNNKCGSETVISGYNIFFLLGTLVVALIIIEKRR